MNVRLESKEEQSKKEGNSLLATCCYLATHVGVEALVAEFTQLQEEGETVDKKELLYEGSNLLLALCMLQVLLCIMTRRLQIGILF